jgi:cell division protein FtsB
MLPKFDQQNIIEKLKYLSDVRVAGLLVFGVIVLLVSWSGLQVMQKNYELEKREARLRAENVNKKLENENLKLKNTYFETDHYLELASRRQFSKAAPGEKLFLVPREVAFDNTVEPAEEENSEQERVKPKSKYQQNIDAWLDFMFSRKS